MLRVEEPMNEEKKRRMLIADLTPTWWGRIKSGGGGHVQMDLVIQAVLGTWPQAEVRISEEKLRAGVPAGSGKTLDEFLSDKDFIRKALEFLLPMLQVGSGG